MQKGVKSGQEGFEVWHDNSKIAVDTMDFHEDPHSGSEVCWGTVKASSRFTNYQIEEQL